MSIELPSRNGLESLSKDNLNAILAHCESYFKLKYDFLLPVKISREPREYCHIFTKTLYRPLMPLSCKNICIDHGVYELQSTTVDMDEKIVYVRLAPIVIHRGNITLDVEAYNQFTKELQEGGWRE